MNRQTVIKVIIWLLVLFTGVAFGAGMYEARVEVPQWFSVADGATVWQGEVAKAADPGLNFWAFVTTGPITLLTLLSVVLIWKTKGNVRRWWLVVLVFLLVDRIMTFSYFIPTMVELMDGKLVQVEAVRVAQQWANLNVVRLIASGLSFVAAIKLLVEWHHDEYVLSLKGKK